VLLLDEALWKKRAAECRRIANILYDADERALMMRLAAVYEVMAICGCRTSLQYNDANGAAHIFTQNDEKVGEYVLPPNRDELQ
jgi:hypothetical protein